MIGYTLSWVKLSESLKEKPGLIALLPIGSFEQHGYHLPLSTDSMVAWRLASMVEQRIPDKVALFPPIVYACSSEHRGFPGTVWVDYHVFTDYAKCVTEALYEAGFTRVAVINAHGGNVQALSVLQRMVNLNPNNRGKLYIFNLTEFRDLVAKVFGRSPTPQHAGYTETSIVEYLCPECVDHDGLSRTPPEDFKTASVQVFTVHPTRDVSKSGIVDYSEPFKAGEKQRGEALLLEIVEAIAKRLSEL
ncbi:MAG: creatininase family protein [Thermoprotei archaeon]